MAVKRLIAKFARQYPRTQKTGDHIAAKNKEFHENKGLENL